MTELEKIAYAKSFLDKLANGINPIDGSVIPDNDVVNNVRLSRCFFYVSDVLRQVIDNGGITQAPPQPKKGKKSAYFLLPEQAERFAYSDIPITATDIASRIIAVGPQEGVRKFPKKKIVKWLAYLDLVEETTIDNHKVVIPTDSGRDIGILFSQRQGQYGSYYVTLYNRNAQQFIIDNIDALLAFDVMEYRKKLNLDNQGKPWSKEQDDMLVALFNDGMSLRDIAYELRRGEKAIRIRLRSNGIDPDSVIAPKSINTDT